MKETLRVAVLTISDRAAHGVYEDKGGPAVAAAARERGWDADTHAVVSDDENEIVAALKWWCDDQRVDVVLTTGGTGLGPRDVTPEATRSVLDRDLPGFSELIRLEGRRDTPLASLSRGVAGVRRRTLIVNLPGNPEGAVQSLRIVAPLLPHAVDMIRGHGHEGKNHENAG